MDIDGRMRLSINQKKIQETGVKADNDKSDLGSVC